MNVLGLCAGIGGLELGLHLAEPRANPVVFIEQDKFCQSVLQQRWPDALIWDNVLTFDGRPWRRCIDVFTAGFPCQPWSLAGLGLGVEDERWFFPQIGELIREVGPEWVFLENVPALVAGGGLAIVLGTLADLGYDAAWGVFSCEQLGASHKRNRVFILGHARSRQLQGLANSVREHFRGQPLTEPRGGLSAQPGLDRQTLEHADCLRGRGNGISDSRRCETKGANEAMADAYCDGCNGQSELHRRDTPTNGASQELANGHGAGLEVREEQPNPQRSATSLSGRALWAPGPGAEWGGISRELWPSEQPVRGMANGLPGGLDHNTRKREFLAQPDRRSRLRALGNAVSPPVGSVAWRVLKKRLESKQQ